MLKVMNYLFLSVFILISTLSLKAATGDELASVVKIGIISDVHDQPKRLQAFMDKAMEEKPDFIIQLGDLSNGKPESNVRMLEIWNTYPGRKYHVLGNHELDYATKEEIVGRQEMPGTYYSFDCGNYHFVVLDCNFILKDGEYRDYANANYYIDKQFRDLIDPEQVEWFRQDVMRTDKKVIVFSHETFDDIEIRGSNPVPNRLLVREVIREVNDRLPTGEHKIIACFAGHDHLDHYNRIDGVHFFAVNSALGFKKGLEIKDSLYEFVMLDDRDRTIRIQGVQSEFLNSPTDETTGIIQRS